jgi:DNA-binding response OmpR family regulator
MSKNIFLVEDDSEMRRITRLLLERAGYLVEESSTAEEAQAEIAKKRPDLLLSDIELPGMSGIQLCERLRNDPRTADLPIILLTVRRSDMDKVKGLRTGADDYITKPFVPQELLARVESVLRRFH